MKTTVLLLSVLTGAAGAFGQGQINFNTRNVGSTLGTVMAPIFGVDQNNPQFSWRGTLWGQGPPEEYVGSRLHGDGFTAELWGGPLGTDEGNLVFVASTVFRTNTSGGFMGHVIPLQRTPTVLGVPAGEYATFQLRVYDNAGGTITSWGQVNPATTAHGMSDLLDPPDPLGGYPPGGGMFQPPNLQGLFSFNLFIVPEPSVVALSVLGLGALALSRRRR